jgi:hypothetical protein
MMNVKKQLVLITILSLLLFLSYIYPQIECDILIDFETMPRDTFGLNFDNAGDLIYTTSNINVYIDSISWLNGGKGYFLSSIDSALCGFGYGKIMRLNNVSLIFDLSQYNTNNVSFTFMDLGGEENFQVNNHTLYNITSFLSLPSTVAPGITCVVDSLSADTCGHGRLIGKVSLNGTVSELLIAGQELWIDSLCIDVAAGSSIDHSLSYQPQNYILEQNYPNPFNASTRITYSIQQAGFVSLKIYNILGQEIQMLVNKFQKTGDYSVSFDAENLSSSIYFYKLQIGDDFLQTKKMLLIR